MSAPIEGALPVPYETTGAPAGLDFANRKVVRAYLKRTWGKRLFTGHGATSAEMPGEAYVFYEYRFLRRAWRTLGMPHSATEEEFRAHYTYRYSGGTAGFENFWERYLDILEVRYEDQNRRARMSRPERRLVRAWKREQDRDLTEEEEEEQAEEVNNEKTIMQWYSDAQAEWNEDAEERLREEKLAANEEAKNEKNESDTPTNEED